MSMLRYILRRLIRMVPTLIVISILTFVIIQLPPGDFFDSIQAQLAESESRAEQEAFDTLRKQYHQWRSGHRLREPDHRVPSYRGASPLRRSRILGHIQPIEFARVICPSFEWR